MQIELNDPDSRREFMKLAARSLLGVGALPLVQGLASASDAQGLTDPSARAKSVIYIYLTGGMSHIDTFDTKPGTDVQGPVESIDTSANGIRISQHLPKTAQQMHHVAIINSMNSTQGAHAQGQYYMHTSYFMRGTVQHPHLGSWASYHLEKRNRMLPANVKIDGSSDTLGAGFLEQQHAAVPIGNPTAGLQYSSLPDDVQRHEFSKRMIRLQQMNQKFQSRYNHKGTRAYSDMYDQAVELMRSRDLKAFDLSLESDANRKRYGDHSFGQGCLLARRLVQHQVRFVEVGSGGWDTHDNNFDRVQEKCAELDDGLSALLADLHSTGLLAETLVVVATEFGRSPTIQTARLGRNHYPQAFTCLMAGGGVRGGIRHGKTDDEGREVVEDLVTVPDFNATIAFALGMPIEEETSSPSGRPFKLADDGQPITSLFSV